VRQLILCVDILYDINVETHLGIEIELELFIVESSSSQFIEY